MKGVSPADWWVVLGYFAVVLAVGLYFGRRNASGEDYFVGGRRVGWAAVLVSIIATEISAFTFLGVAGESFGGDLSYLQFGVGSILARFVVAFLFLGAFFRLRCVSIYQYLGDRFGGTSQRTASIFFLLSRINGSAIRLLLAAVGLSIFFAVPVWLAVVVFTGVALIYTTRGGIRAVIATDGAQAFFFLAGLGAMLWYLGSTVGWGSILQVSAEAEKLHVFHWTPSSGEGWSAWFTDWRLGYLAILNGLVITTAAMGCDQDMTQRMLTCRSVGRARLSLILSGLLGIPIAGLFLLVGLGLYAGQQTEVFYFPESVTVNQVFAYFIAEMAPAGLRGLLLAGILATAMSSLDSAINALGSSALYDLGLPRAWKQRPVLISRLLILFFGLLLAALAIGLAAYEESFVWLGFKIVGISYGALLGVFLVGLLSRRGTDRGNLRAMLCGAALSSLLLALSEAEWIPLAWTWIVLLNVAITALLAVVAAGAGVHNTQARQSGGRATRP